MPHSNHPTYVAMDLGSNSFHMIVVELIAGKVQVVDKVKQAVRLAAGVDQHGALSDDARQRALSCLAHFAQRIEGIPRDRVRAVGTSALRRIKGDAAYSFLDEAEQTLGSPINIISGVEEARLIHFGVQSEINYTDRQLLIDIGGSSTELILADHGRPTFLESLHMGCVVFGQRFKDSSGCYSPDTLLAMYLTACRLLLPHQRDYRNHGWTLACGASGTVKAIHSVLQARDMARGTITADALTTLYNEVLQIADPQQLSYAGLSDDRKPVFHAGVVILHSVFSRFGIQEMEVSNSALREGVIRELMIRDGVVDDEVDVREETVARMRRRYGSNERQAQRVTESTVILSEAFTDAWGLSNTDKDMVRWAATLHEIGLSLSHSGYHKHGAYVVRHADMAGFSHAEQRVLAALVRAQRGTIKDDQLSDVPERSRGTVLPLMLLLRLAILANRGRDSQFRPPWHLASHGDEAVIELNHEWLSNNPLTAADLDAELAQAQRLGVVINLVT